MGETTAVAHGGAPKTALPPQDRAASPRPHWIAVSIPRIPSWGIFEF
ncbi:hypothetical protein BJP36_38555 [Moorena producens JHB]|uniref:Uncharacterized protein n=1 Tax=Moorena producens (strain JHB) TaxID=1454205 RepID=A0A9Q9UWL9_MOOP1|nr:hypothetical protein [Moorena producens]WAN69978.1 hypothetical protein BJP36_38555 [Moorena producens JHB]